MRKRAASSRDTNCVVIGKAIKAAETDATTRLCTGLSTRSLRHMAVIVDNKEKHVTVVDVISRYHSKPPILAKEKRKLAITPVINNYGSLVLFGVDY
jgi:hypothetical protein